jgi:para-nitrobenzyl esterase
LRGKRVSPGVLRFAGIPYAQPPLGELRFKPPRPAQPWDGIRDARDFGPVGIQIYDNLTDDYFLNQSEDCLSANVWTPGTDNKRRPVIVFLHGGGFLLGGANHPTMHGTQFAQRGDVVFVSVQYRLSVLGWLDLEGLGGPEYKHSKNAGLLDQLLALRWVQKNIAAFGGDPGNVTLMGESAGSISATSMMLMPEARKLFHKVIAESATFAVNRTPARATKVTQEFLDETGAKNLNDLLALNTDEIREAIDRLIRRLNLKEQIFFEPVCDEICYPRIPGSTSRRGTPRELIYTKSLEVTQLAPTKN